MSNERPGKQSMTGNEPDPLPRLILHDSDALLRLLHFFQRLLVRNPQAARAIIQAIVAEGRRFAGTSDGRRWKQSLTTSALVQHGRLIWQAYGLDALLENEPALVPSDWLDYLIDVMERADLEAVLSQLMMEGAWYGTLNNP